jgi:hypothetical protein
MIEYVKISLGNGEHVMMTTANFGLLLRVLREPGIHYGHLNPTGSPVTDDWFSRLETKGVVEFRNDTETQPLSGKNAYLTELGQSAVSAEAERREARRVENLRMIEKHRLDRDAELLKCHAPVDGKVKR